MTERMPWLSSMDVGVERIDRDHRLLYALMTDLIDQVELHDVARATATVAQFIAVMDGHFAAEDRVMRDHAYPLADAHMACHARAQVLVGTIAEAVRAPGTIARAVPLLQDLGSTYFRDLLQQDTLLATWMVERGIAMT